LLVICLHDMLIFKESTIIMFVLLVLFKGKGQEGAIQVLEIGL